MIIRRIILLLFCFGFILVPRGWDQYIATQIDYSFAGEQHHLKSTQPAIVQAVAKSSTFIIRGQEPDYGGYYVKELPPGKDAVRATDDPRYGTTTPQTPAAGPRYPAKTTTNPATTTPQQQPPARYPASNPRYPTTTTTNQSPVANKTPVTVYPAGAGINEPVNAPIGTTPGPPRIRLAQTSGNAARNATPFLPETPLVETPRPTPIDLDVMLEEAQTGRVMFGVGVNSDSGLVGNIVVDEQNFDWLRWPTGIDDWLNGTAFRGAGQHFRLEALPGSELQRYSMSFAEPYLFGTSVSFGASAFYYERHYTNWKERRWGGRLSLGYIFPDRPDLSTTFATRYEEVNISDPSVPTPPVLARVVGENQLIGFRWNIAHDTRDNAYLPTEGHLVELAFDEQIGTWVYPRFVGDVRQYFVTRERPDGSGRHVLGMAGTLGVTGGDTPIYDNFFAGGFATLRGFTFRGASPKDGDVTVGGHLELITSVEYLFPLTANDNVMGAFFLDAGTIERNMSINWSDFRVTPGFELRLNVPALGPVPLAVGFGIPVQHAPTDTIRNFHFFVGVSR